MAYSRQVQCIWLWIWAITSLTISQWRFSQHLSFSFTSIHGRSPSMRFKTRPAPLLGISKKNVRQSLYFISVSTSGEKKHGPISDEEQFLSSVEVEVGQQDAKDCYSVNEQTLLTMSSVGAVEEVTRSPQSHSMKCVRIIA